jgi:hypothetical protein
MSNDELSSEIVVRFALTKGEGDFPEEHELTDDEKYSPQVMSEFMLDLDYEKFEENYDPIGLSKITILYDGMREYFTKNDAGISETNGFFWSDEEKTFVGYPTPVIRFHFHKPVNKKIFFSLVMYSVVRVCSKQQETNGSNGYYFEDYSGWAKIIDGDNLIEYIEFLKFMDVYSEKTFSYQPDNHRFSLKS